MSPFSARDLPWASPVEPLGAVNAWLKTGGYYRGLLPLYHPIIFAY